MKAWHWIAAAACIMLPQAAQADYSMHGRISYDSGNTLVRGEGGGDWAYATTNTLILPGDTLWIDQGGLGEAELPQGTFLRLADGSKVEIVSLDPTPVMRGWEGSFYVQRLNRSPGEALFETPAGTLTIESDTNVRIDIQREGNVTVSVRWGRVNVRTHGGSTSVLAGRRTWIDAGLLPATPIVFDRSAEDDFDAWSRERAEYLVRGAAQTPADVTYSSSTIGVSDLSNYGEWVYVDNRHYWRPTVVNNYVPYRTGYWNYVPGAGHVWVGTQPFCYVTSHYGRWNYVSTYGWVWSYDPVWSPAWVVGVRYGDYYAWSPCDYYYRPVLTTQSTRFSIGGVDFSIYSTSYVPYQYLYGGPRYISAYDTRVFAPYQQPGVNVNINIWNVNTSPNRPGHGGGPRTPWDRNVFTERDYSPNRSIRGIQQLSADSQLASARATRLEQSAGRSSYTATASRSDSHQTRTSYRANERSAEVRSVRAVRGSASAFDSTPQASQGRTIDNRTLRNADVPRVSTVRRDESGSRSSEVRSGNATIETPRRSEPSVSRDNNATRESSVRRTEVPNSARTRDYSPTPSRSEVRSAPRETSQQRTETRSQSAPREVTAPRSVVRSEPRSEARVETPQRSETRSYSAPTYRSAPQARTPEPSRSEPRVVRSAPQAERSYSAPRVQPQVQDNSRSFSAPRSEVRGFSAPSSRQAPVVTRQRDNAQPTISGGSSRSSNGRSASGARSNYVRGGR
ncbi:MAG: hypothetical protein GC168_11490 [Candidatus Hydrogenedens sp.]|nr:hypothetical protein [Candidatus Hydrogenedens sp.]